MSTWLEIAESLNGRAKDSAVPMRWVWVGLAVVAVVIAGWLISREQTKAAVAQADIDLKRKQAEENVVLAKAMKNTLAASEVLASATRLIAEANRKQEAVDAWSAALVQKKARLEAAKTWKELEDA